MHALGRSLSVKSSSSRKTSGTHSTRRESSDMVEDKGPRPAEVLGARFTEWKHIIKALVAYFEGIVSLENSHSKELTKLSGELTKVVPLTEAWQFLPDPASKTPPGWSSAIHFFRDKNGEMSGHHSSLAKALTTGVIDPLKQLRVEIKDHVKAVDTEIRKLHDAVAKERDASVRAVQDLTLGITKLGTTPTDVAVAEDPWIAKGAATKQFHQQIDQENALTNIIIEFHRRSKILEENIAKTLSTAMLTVQHANTNHLATISQTWASISSRLSSIPPLAEWEHFAHLPGSELILLPGDTPLRSHDVSFPGQDDPSTEAVYSGVLERKKRIVKKFAVAYYVLSPAGYLHEYKDSSEKHGAGALGGNTPTLSLFLPNCTLGPAPDRTAKEYKWHIEGRKSSGTSLKLGKGETAHTFRASSYDEMVKWHELMEKYAKVALTFKGREQDAEGPGIAAVRSAGVAVEDDESGIESGEETDENESSARSPAYTPAAAGVARSVPPPLPQRSATQQTGHEANPGEGAAAAAAAAAEHQASVPPPLPQRQVTTNPNGTTTITTIHFDHGASSPRIEHRTVSPQSTLSTSPAAGAAASPSSTAAPEHAQASAPAPTSNEASSHPPRGASFPGAFEPPTPATIPVSDPIQQQPVSQAHLATTHAHAGDAPEGGAGNGTGTVPSRHPTVHFSDDAKDAEEGAPPPVEGEPIRDEKKGAGSKFMELI